MTLHVISSSNKSQNNQKKKELTKFCEMQCLVY